MAINSAGKVTRFCIAKFQINSSFLIWFFC